MLRGKIGKYGSQYEMISHKYCLLSSVDSFLTLDAVIDGEDVDPLAVLDVGAALDGHHVAEPYPQVVPHHAVHPDLVVSDGVVRQHDAHALLPLLTLKCDNNEYLS